MQKFDEGFFPRASKEVNSLIWSGIEVVITRRTRNAFAVDSGTWVRIPPTPPYENQVLYVVQDFFFCPRRGQRCIFYLYNKEDYYTIEL